MMSEVFLSKLWPQTHSLAQDLFSTPVSPPPTPPPIDFRRKPHIYVQMLSQFVSSINLPAIDLMIPSA